MPFCRVYITLHYISSHVYFISTRTAGGGTRQTGRDSSCDPRASVRVSILGYCLRFVISSRHINQKTVTAHGARTPLPLSLSLMQSVSLSLSHTGGGNWNVTGSVAGRALSPVWRACVRRLNHQPWPLCTAIGSAPVACWHCPAAPTSADSSCSSDSSCVSSWCTRSRWQPCWYCLLVVVAAAPAAAVGAANVTLTVNYEYLRNFLIKIANVPR